MANEKQSVQDVAENLEAKGGATSEDFAALYAQSIVAVNVKPGQIMKGKIIAINPKDVLIDIGYKSEGLIPIAEFSDPESIKIGDEIDVYLESTEDESGMVVLSKQKAERAVGWEMVIAKCNEGDVVEGKVTKKVKGGFMVNIGVEAFLPASLAAMRSYGNLNQMVGQVFSFKIVKINKPRKNIVVSRKDALNQQRDERRAFDTRKRSDDHRDREEHHRLWRLVDLGSGTIGLLHITDMSWARIASKRSPCYRR